MRQLSSREVYRNPWMVVREDTIERGDGTSGSYGVVDKPDFALVVPVDRQGFWMVEQYRYPVRRRAWEFPQGSWGAGQPGGTAEELARSELAEETGLRAGLMRPLGHLFGAYGFCSQGFTVWLAEDLTSGPTGREDSEQDMDHRHVAEPEFRQMVANGDIVDAATLAAFSLYELDRMAG
ncbi:MAG: NUDIX hydrolase [Candidatus Nanopelagicales bacterium]